MNDNRLNKKGLDNWQQGKENWVDQDCDLGYILQTVTAVYYFEIMFNEF